ncbi:hypothetical protein WMF04_41290 [Sorangium sp. So ce260]|uniref:hypothetical protein n=1 Tax=Sorangium sp. So ce260 TaxID=3133291 RepID=UPI003F5E7D49
MTMFVTVQVNDLTAVCELHLDTRKSPETLAQTLIEGWQARHRSNCLDEPDRTIMREKFAAQIERDWDRLRMGEPRLFQYQRQNLPPKVQRPQPTAAVAGVREPRPAVRAEHGCGRGQPATAAIPPAERVAAPEVTRPEAYKGGPRVDWVLEGYETQAGRVAPPSHVEEGSEKSR